MLIGHKKIWEFFLKSVENNSLSHAYLFSGKNKIGKKRVVLEVVKLLNCQNIKDNSFYRRYPCLECRNCLDIEKNQFPDLFILKNDKDKKEIDINKIRYLKNSFSLKAYNSKFKIVIIDDAHLMNISAQNALLKILEEPFGTGKTIIFLITDKSKQLLETILSRVQELKFFNPTKNEVENYLLTIDISDEVKKEIEKFSFGKIGCTIDYINNPQKLDIYKNKIQELKIIIKSPLHIRFNYIKKIIDNSNDKEILEILVLWINYFQELLIYNKINEKEKLKIILRKINKTYILISGTPINRKLALENLVLEF